MKEYVERLRSAQRGGDVLEESKLWKAGLVDRSSPPIRGGTACMAWVLRGTLSYP